MCGTYSRSAIRVEGCRTESLDLRREGSASALVRRLRPAAVIHAAALVDIDLCESEPALAMRINAGGTREIAEAAAETGARLIYFSTDMVFDGERGMYAEEDEPNPINHYGRTKLAGERHVMERCPGGVVARLALVYGTGNKAHGSFLSWTLDRLEKGRPVNLFTDQYRTPTYVGDICRAVEIILERNDIAGLYHFAGPERLNRHEFGLRLAELFGFDRALLVPSRMSDLKELMPRPKDNSMLNRKAEKALGIRFMGVTDGLRAVAAERGAGCAISPAD